MLKLARRLCVRAASIAILLVPVPAAAFWEYGHETVATIAESNVSPATKREIRRLLAHSALLETPTCPARTIEQASVWPDCIKRLEDRFSYAAPWHYQNVDICRPFDQESACRDGNCVSAQIERNARLLADRSLPMRERVMALAFLVHLVGDLHQPLHAGDRGDLGGNRFAASYGLIAGRTNLHTIWDGFLAERAISTPLGGAAGLLGEMPQAEREAARQGDVAAWARESWQVGHDFAYATMLPDPCAPVPAQRPRLAEEQIRMLIPTVRRQVARGGLRLARMLDQALGEGSGNARPEASRGG